MSADPKEKRPERTERPSTALIRETDTTESDEGQVQQETLLTVYPDGGDISVALMNKAMKIHATAKAFPSLPEKEAAELRADIKKNGIRVPILINKAGDTILDGRNRWMIAYDLGLRKSQVPVERFSGEDHEIPRVIISLNLFRRHLTDKERAALVTKLLAPQLEAEAAAREKGGKAIPCPENDTGSEPEPEPCGEFRTRSGRTVDQLAAAANVSAHKTRQALKVRAEGGDKALDEIISGKADLTKKAKAVATKTRKPAKVLPFEQQVWQRWTRWFEQWEQDERGKVIRLVLEWASDKKGDAE
jgi:ParB-like chromosome segregation protein Spo0J